MQTFYELLVKEPSVEKEICSCNGSIDQEMGKSLAARIFSTGTFLKANGLNPESFSTNLRSILKKAEGTPSSGERRPFLVAFLPCGLRNAFKQALTEEFPEYNDDECEDIFIEGNLNFEKIIYRYIDCMESPEELPDIFITADYNSLYHGYFLNNFLSNTYFEPLPVVEGSALKSAGFLHPQNNMLMFSANLLVCMTDSEKFTSEKFPESWNDLLSEEYAKSIVFRGDKDFFCNAAFFPFYKSGGAQAIEQLGKNTITGMHPSEMVKSMNTGNALGAKVYVMPYSFAIKVRNPRFKLIIPHEGAIASPVQILVKKGAYEKHKPIIDFLQSKQLGLVLENIGFPSISTQNEGVLGNIPIHWLGWDYIYNNDLSVIKDSIQEHFFKSYLENKK